MKIEKIVIPAHFLPCDRVSVLVIPAQSFWKLSVSGDLTGKRWPARLRRIMKVVGVDVVVADSFGYYSCNEL